MKLAFVLSGLVLVTGLSPAFAQEEPTVLASQHYSIRCKSHVTGLCGVMKRYLEGQEPGMTLTAAPAETRQPDVMMGSRVYQLDCWDKSRKACDIVRLQLDGHRPNKR